jgi:hypothetical protein
MLQAPSHDDKLATWTVRAIHAINRNKRVRNRFDCVSFLTLPIVPNKLMDADPGLSRIPDDFNGLTLIAARPPTATTVGVRKSRFKDRHHGPDFCPAAFLGVIWRPLLLAIVNRAKGFIDANRASCPQESSAARLRLTWVGSWRERLRQRRRWTVERGPVDTASGAIGQGASRSPSESLRNNRHPREKRGTKTELS